MAEPAPMRTRRTRRDRPAGFAAAVPQAPSAPVSTPSEAAPAPAPDRKQQVRAAPAPAKTTPTPAGRSDEPAPRSRDPYAGAPSSQVNVRLLEPLRARYVGIARELTDDGFKTTFTELLTALLDDGPATPDEARDLLRKYRRRREA